MTPGKRLKELLFAVKLYRTVFNLLCLYLFSLLPMEIYFFQKNISLFNGKMRYSLKFLNL